jgi:hypothetical protein
MKHAGPLALEALELLLEELRKIAGLVERKRGIFYQGAAAFVHFHEDPAGMVADLRSGADFERYAVNTPAEIARDCSAPPERRHPRYAARSDIAARPNISTLSSAPPGRCPAPLSGGLRAT